MSIDKMCELGGVSRAMFYRHWLASEPKQADTAVRDQVQQEALANRFYGYRRVTHALKQRGVEVNAKRVLRLMRSDNLLCLRGRRYIPMTTDARHTWRNWPNLARGLVTQQVNELWVADITYVRLREAFVYVAVVLDAHSRRVIGWSLATHLGANLAIDALKMALRDRRPQPGMIHHSDRGVQYACSDYLSLLAEHGIEPSMSRPGNPYDNAKAESFMKTLKQEQLAGNQWRDLDALHADLERFFEQTYNRERLHSSLGYQTPAAFERACSAGSVSAAPTALVSTGWTGARGASPQTPLPELLSKGAEDCP